AAVCRREVPRCEKCAERHETKSCVALGKVVECVHCRDAHGAGDQTCPVRERQLSLLFPNQLILGLEICGRLRPRPYPLPACFSYGNVACLRCNTMRYLPNFFSKGQLSKMFLLFPEPHFKKTQAQVADVSPTLLAEYTYTLKEGGLVYTNTDMEEVLHWMVKHFSEHPLFTRVPTQNWYDDAHFEQLMMSSSEEGKKVQRNGRKNYLAGFPQSGILKSQYYRYQLYVR
uniref:tRNA (guanine(46)-N(7))-methyltransferase n=1 Tax=Oncorhynchus kisutch TaxID=8019 RepID=A0A8C7CRL1_ONCKI